MSLLIAVAGGGAIGALLRFGTHLGAERLLGDGFLIGTLTVNLVGSFALGVAMAYFGARPVPEATRVFLTFGLLGAFTTFSTFSLEAVTLLQDAEYGRAATYVGGSVVLGLVAFVAGTSVGALATSSPLNG